MNSLKIATATFIILLSVGTASADQPAQPPVTHQDILTGVRVDVNTCTNEGISYLKCAHAAKCVRLHSIRGDCAKLYR